MTIKVEVLGGNAPPEVAEMIRKLFGGGDGGQDAQMKSEQDKLKAAGWTAHDLCALNGAIELVREHGAVTLKYLMHMAVGHDSLFAARTALALAEWGVHCCGQIDHAAHIVDGRPTDDGIRDFWTRGVEHARTALAKLEQAEELRQSVAHVH